jgi:hypothetical protein
VELLFISMRCGMESLMKECQEYIIDNIAAFENKIDALMIADLISSRKMRFIVIKLVIDEYRVEFRRLCSECKATTSVARQQVRDMIEEKLKVLEVRDDDILDILEKLH